MFYTDEEYYEQLEAQRRDEYVKSINYYNKPAKKKTKDQVFFLFEDAIIYRINYKFSDYCRDGTYYKYMDGVQDAFQWLKKQNPYSFRYSYKWLMKHWDDKFYYFTSGRDWANEDETRWFIEKFIDEQLLPNAQKYYANKTVKAKPTFTLEAPKTPIIEPKKQEVEIVKPVINEKIINGKGRPKGSKNKKQEEMKPPVHKVDDKTIVPALQDIIWYADGLKANEIMQYIEADESIIKLIYGKLHENAGKLWEKRVCGITPSGAKIERFYPLTPRKGYFFNGEILTLSVLARITGMAKQTLSYRISKGLNHIDAIKNQINENMKRK
jgi:hypothetical protein